MYDTYQRRIAECDNELEAHLKSFADNVPPKLTEDQPPAEQKVRISQKPKLTHGGKRALATAPSLTCAASCIGSAGWI